MEDKHKIDFENINRGDVIPLYKVKMDRKTYFEYNKLVNEINPLHFDENYAKALGFKGIVVAGVYTFSFIPRMIADWIGRPGSIRNMEIRYIIGAVIGAVVGGVIGYLGKCSGST